MSNELAINYNYLPAVIEMDFAAIETQVSLMVEPYVGMTEEGVAGMDVKLAKNCRADLNRIYNDLEAVRKTVKKQYTEPLTAFEKTIKDIERQVTDPRDLIDQHIKSKEAKEKEFRYDSIQAAYFEFLEANGVDQLAQAIDFDAQILESQWLNKSFGEIKAINAMEEKLARILAEWQAVKKQTFHYPQEAEACFFRTLDLRSVIENDQAKKEEQERIEAFNRQVRNAVEIEPEPANNEPENPIFNPNTGIKYKLILPEQTADVILTDSEKSEVIRIFKLLGVHGTFKMERQQ